MVLLVEDDPDQLALGELRLTMAGYQVRSVDRAKALSRFLREEPRPDLLLLDVMLPDGNGFDILAQLRARPEFAMLPIVLLTVKAELVHIRNGLALGADGYITKPYSKNQLAEVIGRVLKHRPRDLEVDQRPILLAAEHVPVARAAARPQPVDRELDRIGDVEIHEVRQARLLDPVELRDRVGRDRAAA